MVWHNTGTPHGGHLIVLSICLGFYLPPHQIIYFSIFQNYTGVIWFSSFFTPTPGSFDFLVFPPTTLRTIDFFYHHTRVIWWFFFTTTLGSFDCFIYLFSFFPHRTKFFFFLFNTTLGSFDYHCFFHPQLECSRVIWFLSLFFTTTPGLFYVFHTMVLWFFFTTTLGSIDCHTQLNSTQSWVSLIFLRNHTTNHEPQNQRVSHFISTKLSMHPYFNPTRRFLGEKFRSPDPPSKKSFWFWIWPKTEEKKFSTKNKNQFKTCPLL